MEVFQNPVFCVRFVHLPLEIIGPAPQFESVSAASARERAWIDGILRGKSCIRAHASRTLQWIVRGSERVCSVVFQAMCRATALAVES